MPLDRGTGLRSRSRASRLAAVVVVGVTGLLGVLTWLRAPARESPDAPSSVITAAGSVAATPSVASELHRLLRPELRAVAATGHTWCRDPRVPVLRVLQFNIRAARTSVGDVNLREIASEIKAVRPDLVSLNEVDSETTRTRADEPAYLAAATRLHVVYGPNLVYDGGPFGNAVLSRYPVVDSHNLRLPGMPGLEPRGLLTVTVSVAGRRVVFASTHLSDDRDHGQESRPRQALAVALALDPVTDPVILAGDLNSAPDDGPARILRRGLLDVQEESGNGPGDTYPQEHPSSRFDYIFHDRHLAAVPQSTQVRASGSSDHRSVFTKLALLTRQGC